MSRCSSSSLNFLSLYFFLYSLRQMPEFYSTMSHKEIFSRLPFLFFQAKGSILGKVSTWTQASFKLRRQKTFKQKTERSSLQVQAWQRIRCAETRCSRRSVTPDRRWTRLDLQPCREMRDTFFRRDEKGLKCGITKSQKYSSIL